MSGQNASASDVASASGSANPKPPKTASYKKRKARKSAKKRNAIKNTKMQSVTTPEKEVETGVTLKQDDNSRQANGPELKAISEQSEDREPLVDPKLAVDSAAFAPKTCEQDAETGGILEQVDGSKQEDGQLGDCEQVVGSKPAENLAAFEPQLSERVVETDRALEQVDDSKQVDGQLGDCEPTVDSKPAENLAAFEPKTSELDAATGGTIKRADDSKQMDDSKELTKQSDNRERVLYSKPAKNSAGKKILADFNLTRNGKVAQIDPNKAAGPGPQKKDAATNTTEEKPTERLGKKYRNRKGKRKGAFMPAVLRSVMPSVPETSVSASPSPGPNDSAVVNPPEELQTAENASAPKKVEDETPCGEFNDINEEDEDDDDDRFLDDDFFDQDYGGLQDGFSEFKY